MATSEQTDTALLILNFPHSHKSSSVGQLSFPWKLWQTSHIATSCLPQFTCTARYTRQRTVCPWPPYQLRQRQDFLHPPLYRLPPVAWQRSRASCVSVLFSWEQPRVPLLITACRISHWSLEVVPSPRVFWPLSIPNLFADINLTPSSALGNSVLPAYQRFCSGKSVVEFHNPFSVGILNALSQV